MWGWRSERRLGAEKEKESRGWKREMRDREIDKVNRNVEMKEGRKIKIIPAKREKMSKYK